MKSLQVLAYSIGLLVPLAVGAASPTAFTATPAPTPNADLVRLLAEAQTAYLKGDLPTAKMDFELVLQIDSHNRTAIGYLRSITAKESVQSKGAALEKQLSGLMIPKLDFKEATLGAALDYMKNAAERLSGGKLSVNFVVLLPPDQIKTQTVTLSLSNIPYTEALRYIGGLAALKFNYEKYAITVKPDTEAASATGAAAPGTAPVPR